MLLSALDDQLFFTALGNQNALQRDHTSLAIKILPLETQGGALLPEPQDAQITPLKFDKLKTLARCMNTREGQLP